MKFASGIFGVTLAVALSGQGAWAQAGENTSPDKMVTPFKQDTSPARVDKLSYQVFYLVNSSQQNEANEVVIAVRDLLPPDTKIYLVQNQNAIVVRATSDQLLLIQKVINDLDRPKKTYRLTFTIVESDGGKRVGSQRYDMVVVAGQRASLKEGSKVPIVTGSFAANSSGTQTQMTYLDVGMNFDVTLDEFGNGGRLRSKVEQLSMAEEKGGLGPQDPVIRQTVLEGTSFMTQGKSLVLGGVDIPGSTRHLDIEVSMELVK
jgi:type II secretory pathway component GspD/PulD (secretin)